MLLNSTYLLFNEKYYDQLELEVATGSPLSPTVADLFIESFEHQALLTTQYKPSGFFRFVDDTFVIGHLGIEKMNYFVTF